MEEDEWDDALLSEIAALESRHLQNHSHQNQPTAAGVWICRSCTLQNEASRGTCLVCSTPRGQSYKDAAPAPSPVRASTAPRKTIQARLSFDGTSAPVAVPPSQQRQQQEQEADVGRSEPSLFMASKEQPVRSSQQTVLTPATTRPGLVLTSRRSGHGAAATSTRAAASPVQMPRRAAGEDSQAKTRYLDIMARSNFPQIDYEAAQNFVYPTNYSIRDYQLTIAEKALYHNTLVSLPTGLGKTLVAAVVMYNFYRWFPTGKIVFMAPTKPLVAQQIKACHEIMGIPLSDTAELQGNVPPTMRRVLWSSRRVFFCTPQSLQNDLRRGVCAAEKFVCIVVDEAHRATGNYAYCCVVQEIEAKTHFFRVLALSATPGAKFDVIQDVVTNLRISHIESRSADDPDVKKYTHARQEEVIVCHLGAQIMEMKAQLLKCFAPIIQRLLRGNLIQHSDPEKLSSWYILQVRERFRKSPNYSSNRSAESDLALLVSLLHAKSLLTGHGLSSFREQIMSWGEERKKGKMSWSKREMLQSTEFQALELSLAVTPGTNISTTASHPKLVKLREVLLEHFQRHAVGKSSTRAIVFTQYRASVSEIVALLRPLAPLLSAQPFIGQGASGKAKENKGQTQKVQQDIVRRFRLGEFNVLVATCIAEEGLDIGEVDLIVSFDALTSPVRMIQRMGRTGRKRVGRVIILVTEGDEQKKLARSASAAKTVSRALTTFKNKFTYSKCPRMLPTCLYPQLSELEMKIPTFQASQVGGKAASGAVDPDLWQLSDAERAVAMMKYFPPNFASSSRNKLFPVVANRLHLLRYQPRSLVRKGVSNRVGYSARSLMLQRLVRKINGVEEVLDSESDDEEDKSDGNGDQKNTLNSSNAVEGASTDDDDHLPTTPRLEASENPGRSSVTTNNAEIDSEMVSPWRPTSTPGDLGDARRCDESFAVMDESVNFVDMHFSPQFVETATQFASAAEVDEPSSDSNKRQQESQGQISSAKKQKTDSCSQDLSPVICTPKGPIQASETSAAANDKGAQTEDVLVHAFGDQRISTENLENEQLSATSSLTLTSDSPRPSPSSRVEAHQQQEVVVVIEANNSTEPTQQLPIVPRLHGIRQLQFDEDAGEGDDWDQTQSAEMPQDELAVPTANAGPPSENHDVCPVEDEPPIFSFALLQPRIDTKIGTKAESDASDGDQAEVEPSAYSFALLPPLDEKTGVVLEPTNIAAAPQKEASQQVDDGTDGDELDENEANTMINNELAVDTGSTADMNASVMDTAAVKHDENVKPEDPILSPKPRTTVDVDAAQQPLQSERKDTEPEQEDEDGCSICLEKAKKKRKTFRRLKRKYDASQSQIFTQPGTKGSPAGTSPWQKRIRRSKQRRETSRALAAAFIDDTAEVRGGARDDDDEDDYGDDYKDAADDSFINDSSQLLYSQSVVFPGDAGSSSTKKQKRKKSSPNMRAIYARSLFESQGSPLLFRRGGRQLGALPSNGIIRACLDELHNGPTGADTPSPRPRSRSRLPETLEDAAAMPSIFSAQVGASATIMEVVDEDDSSAEAEPSPSFNLLEAAKAFSGVQHEIQIQTEKEGSAHANSVDPDMAPPSFSLLGANGSHSDGQETDLAKTTTQQVASVAVNSSKKPHGDDMHNMIEANRLKALKKLEERRQAKLQAQQPQQRPSHEDKLPALQLDRGQEANTSHDIGFTSAASLVSRKVHEDEKAPPTFSLLPATSSRGLMSPARGAQVPTVDLTSPEPTMSGPTMSGPTQSQSQPPKWIVFVSSSFASSSDFPTFALAKHTECTVAIDEALEADALLSVRVGVLVLTVQQLRELARSAPARNVVKSRRVGTMLAMHKKVVVAIVHDGKDPPEVLRLRQLPNAMVIVQPHLQSLSANLHQLAQQELAKGYELPSPSLCRSDFNGGAVRGLDADFASRLDFFRSIPPMSLGSALSLSFRFKNFAVAQVPVLKFNEMHWRRMLPWISEPTAEAIRKHVQQNLQRS
ncbi:hypothetical protein PRNP1_006315 [Phytophthora ramorum]